MRYPTHADWERARDNDQHSKVRELLPRLDWNALWEAEEDIEWLIDPIMPERSLVALYSPAGIGKSLLMLELGAGLSAGKTILGHTPRKRYRVLYIDFENDPIRDIRDRLQNMGYEPDDLTHLDFLSFPTLAHLDSQLGASELLAAIEAYGSEVVVIDTISRAVGGEENDNDTWLNFYRHTGLALKQRGVALIRLDHTGKDLTKGERGGSAKSGDVDAAWKLTELEEGKRFKLTNTKSRFRLEERELVILRQDEPLRHVREDLSKLDEQEVRVSVLLGQLNQSGLPKETGAPAFRKWLQQQGTPYRSKDLTAAIKRRKSAGSLVFEPEKADLNPLGQHVRSAPDLNPLGQVRSVNGNNGISPSQEPNELTQAPLGQLNSGLIPQADLKSSSLVGLLLGSVQDPGQINGRKQTCDICEEPLDRPTYLDECSDRHEGGR